MEPEAQALKALSEYGLEHEQNGLTLTLDIHSVFDDRWIMILRVSAFIEVIWPSH
jgi:hypothetical protein